MKKILCVSALVRAMLLTFHPPPPGLRPYGAPGERLGDRLGDYVTFCLWSPGPYPQHALHACDRLGDYVTHCLRSPLHLGRHAYMFLSFRTVSLIVMAYDLLTYHPW